MSKQDDKNTANAKILTPAEESAKRLNGLLSDFEQALLLTKDTASEWTHGRPMFLLHVSDSLELYFGAPLDSTSVDELIRHPQVAVTMQQGRCAVFMNGFASVKSGEAIVGHGWHSKLKPMLREGESFERDWGLIQVRPHALDYWDYNLGTTLRYMAAQLKAKLFDRESPNASKFFEAHLASS